MKIWQILDYKYARYVEAVVGLLKSLPDKDTLNRPSSSTWETLQLGDSWFEEHESSVRKCCLQVIETLPADEQELLYMWTDDFYCALDYRPIYRALEEEFFARVRNKVMLDGYAKRQKAAE